ncbi:MAG: GvpL/GvpF family gas vesicle protein [Armatimonadota bacterium]|nr:GvpL/GvpF family gas vesicle protein [Armatimonadota bacterium]
MSEGMYMYCVIRCGRPRQFSTLGIGERGDIVYTVPFEDLAAVVSNSPIVEYEGRRRNFMAHAAVLEEVMREYAILPIRFGTVAPSSEAFQKALKRRGREFHALLDEMEGRKELGLRAFLYEGAIFQEVVDENPAIRQLRDSLVGVPPEQSHYDRMKLGEMVQKAVVTRRDADAEAILARLRPLAHEHKSNAPVTDRMVLNAAFLVDQDREAEFDQAVQQLDQEMGSRLIFKYVDQVPPYNFVDIAINWNE